MFDQSDHGLTPVNFYLIESARICLKGPYTHNFQLIIRHMMPRIKSAIQSNSNGTWVEFQEKLCCGKKMSN